MLRTTGGFSQKELALYVDRSIHTIRAIEQGKLSIGKGLAKEISDRLGVHPRWLLDEKIDGPPFGIREKTLTKQQIRKAIIVSRDLRFRAVAAKYGLALTQIIENAINTPARDAVFDRAYTFIQKMIDDFGASSPIHKKSTESAQEDLLSNVKPEAIVEALRRVEAGLSKSPHASNLTLGDFVEDSEQSEAAPKKSAESAKSRP